MPTRPQCTRVAMTYYQESDLAAVPVADYGTAVPSAHIDKLFEPTEPVILELSQNRIDDADMIKGNEFPQDLELDIIIAQDISVPFTFPFSLELGGMMFALAMGGYSVSDAGGGNYVHTMKAMDPCTSDELPSTSWMLGFVGDLNSQMLLKGVMINDLKLALDSPGRLTMSGTAYSDGTLTPDRNYVFPTTLTPASWPLVNTADFKFDGVSKKTTFRSFEFTISNNLDLADGRSNVINAGIYLDQLRFGKRTYSLTAKMDGHQGSEIWNLWRLTQGCGNTDSIELDIQVGVCITPGVINDNKKVTLNFPKVRIAQIKQGFDGIRDVLDITFKIFYDTVDATPVTITFYNQVAEYLLLHDNSTAASPSASTSPTPSPSASRSPSASTSV